MRKELIIAIFVGIGVGVALAFGFYRANSALKTTSSNTTSTNAPDKAQNTSDGEAQTTLARPKQNEVITESPTLISGISNPNSWITVSGEEEDYILQAGANGAFEQEVDLASGVNQIIITSFDDVGGKNSTNLTIVYSTEFAE